MHAVSSLAHFSATLEELKLGFGRIGPGKSRRRVDIRSFDHLLGEFSPTVSDRLLDQREACAKNSGNLNKQRNNKKTSLL